MRLSCRQRGKKHGDSGIRLRFGSRQCACAKNKSERGGAFDTLESWFGPGAHQTGILSFAGVLSSADSAGARTFQSAATSNGRRASGAYWNRGKAEGLLRTGKSAVVVSRCAPACPRLSCC